MQKIKNLYKPYIGDCQGKNVIQTPVISTVVDANDNRIIYCDGDFNECKVNEITKQLIRLEISNPNKDILIIINSYGGFVDGFIAMHDAIKMCRCHVATLCLGKAMSAGQLLLISGTPGKRFITENSRTLIHEISTGTYGSLSKLDNDIIETKRLQKIIEDMIIKYTKINKIKLRELMSKDSYLSAKESLKLGLVDHIISTPKDLYGRINI